VPLLLSLATNAEDLEAYFVIAATSIPVQFIAQDILQYQSGTHRLSAFERVGMPIFACGSIAYVTWHHGLTIGGTYLIFASALLFYGASVGRLRDFFTAERVLAADALYNTVSTLLAVTAVMLLKGDPKLGLAVILSQAGAASAVGLLNVLASRREHCRVLAAPASRPPTVDRSSSATPLILAGLMVTTQLERLVIAAVQPSVLMSITLAAGVTQAWRKIGMDDALVFERLRQRCDTSLDHAMLAELKHARRVFYPPMLLALLAYVFIDDIAAWSTSHGIFQGLNRASYGTTAAILCIYLAAMPPAIVMINTLRQRVLPIHRMGWGAILIVALLEIVVLVFPHSLGRPTDLAMGMITLSASLYYALFLALIPARRIHSAQVLFFDIAVFFLVLIALIWITVP
jgi:hypothetical protein